MLKILKIKAINKTIILATIPAVLLALYLPFNRPFGEVHSFYHPIDNHIPLLTIFVVPYISYYFLLIFTFVLLLKSRKDTTSRLISNSLTVAIVASYIFYFFYQNSVERPMIVEQTIFDQIYTFINYHVAPFNAFPSLHVAVSTIVWYGLYKLKVFPTAMFFWVIFIILSTVLTKQHYFLDIIGGLLLAVGSIWITEKVHQRYHI